ncbi:MULTISPECIES: sirohydrochlorin chelatase [unclassified Streptomyces]|uniref:sirohydrochlorin chelatase n=1 Tax=unclassified Streptomyces TaxID=2593676 RepID=UPI0011E661AA|nr:cobalamin biosynthesis protein CbiX [Streptomyces sp. sk2.1]TXS68804.1 cobalamin biosynthesis protein CbiX [Streptomyces sp. sk2.1]
MSDHCRVIAVCGHEAAYGDALHGLVDPGVTVVPNGRELFRAVAAPGRRDEECCVVPMTLGRDPELVADAARTLRALPAAVRARTVLAEPFGTSRHLTGWLRAAAGRAPDTAALLITAPSGDPFEDAELYRVAGLVRRHGSHDLVEVAFAGGDPDPAEGVRRCALLGARQVVLLPAAFARPTVPDAPGVRVGCAGPLLAPAALARVLAERVADARRRGGHGDDGIAAGLTAAADHGHSHTHPPGAAHHHGHGHPHPHPHPHVHGAGQVIRSTA